jgi:acetoin utilization deacetylase AcuC-like enzyme
VLDAARPELVCYLGGADPFVHDRFGRLGLSVAGLGDRDRQAFAAIRGRGIPLVLTMAGGYARRLEDVVAIQANTVGAALAAYA